MTLPQATEEIRDPGLGVSQPAVMTPVIYGVTSLGAQHEAPVFYSSPSTLRSERGVGPAVDLALYILTQVGGPVGIISADPSVAADNSEVTPPGSGTPPTVTVAGDALFDASVRIEIMGGGDLGAGLFRYSLDTYSGDTEAERTYSETLTIPAGGTFAIPGFGVTVTFGAGTYVEDDVYTFDGECAAWNATDLAAAFTALQTSKTPWRFFVAVTSRNSGDAAAHATLAAALETHMGTLANASKYRRAMIASTQDPSEAASAIVTAYTSTVAPRTLIAHGEVRKPTQLTLPGYAFPRRPAVDCFAMRAAGCLPSTDLKRVRGNGRQDGGPLLGVLKLFFDADQDAGGVSVDSAKISTLRTYEGVDGFFITQGRLKSAEGSDFTVWPRGIVMDIACETAHAGQVLFIGSGFRLNADGTIDDRDASAWEEEIGAKIAAQVLTPRNAEGFDGHVTDVRYRIVRTHNVLATNTILGEVGILPLGYADFITTVLGFEAQLPVAA